MSERLAAARALVATRKRENSRPKGWRARETTIGCAGYVLRFPGRLKIGISNAPKIRELEISLAAGQWVETLAVVWFPTRSAAQDWEATAHRALKRAHILGEWFEEQAALGWLDAQPLGPGSPAGEYVAARPRLP